MDLPGTVISSLRLAYSVIPEQESASEKRRWLYDVVAGRTISFTPEVGERVELQLRNCAFHDEANATYLVVSVNDPNRPENLFELETDVHFYHLNGYIRHGNELNNSLIDKMNFVELGPEDFKIELEVNSTDPPTLEMAFERIETILSHVHSEFHRFLRFQYEEYKNEFEVTMSFEDGQMRYEAETDLDETEMTPKYEDGDFDLQKIREELDVSGPVLSHYIFDYVKYVVTAEASGENYFPLS